jgi:hypothetical protein
MSYPIAYGDRSRSFVRDQVARAEFRTAAAAARATTGCRLCHAPLPRVGHVHFRWLAAAGKNEILCDRCSGALDGKNQFPPVRRGSAGAPVVEYRSAPSLTAARRRELAEMYGGRPVAAGPYAGCPPEPGAYNPGVLPSASHVAAARWLARQS